MLSITTTLWTTLLIPRLPLCRRHHRWALMSPLKLPTTPSWRVVPCVDGLSCWLPLGLNLSLGCNLEALLLKTDGMFQ